MTMCANPVDLTSQVGAQLGNSTGLVHCEGTRLYLGELEAWSGMVCSAGNDKRWHCLIPFYYRKISLASQSGVIARE